MKDRLNFWLTVLVMIVAGLWVYNINGWGATPTYNGGTWYSYYYGTPAKSSSGTLLDVDVFPPATGNIEYEYRRQSSKLITTYLDATYTCNGTQTTDQSSCDRDMSDFASDKYFGNVPENIEHLKVERTGREATVEMRNIKLKLKKHIRLENSTTVGTTNLTIDNTSETYYFGQEYEFTIPIRSFLADGNFTISLESGSDASFYLPTTSIALAQSGTNICAIRNSSTNDPRTSGGAASTLYNASYCDITVKYRPMSTTEEKCTVKVQVGTSVAYAIIKAKGTNIASFGTVENYKVSAEKELLPAYRASSSSNVTVTINSQGQHYQIYNGSSWINGNSTITLTSDQKFKIRFAPTDAWGEADGTGTGNAKSANIVVQQGSNSYSMPITGTPKVATTTLSPLNISLQNLTTHSSNPTISLNDNFKITVTNQRGTGDPYNTATEKNKITLVSQDEDVVKAVKNSDNTSYTIQILGGGETTIVATLPAYAEHHTTSNCTIAVKVEKIQQTISWTSCPTSPVDVFSEHDLLATVGYTAGTVSAITYTVNPSDAATVANGKIKITKRYETFTVTARTSETATYKSASSQKTISVNKVYPIIVWASSSPELSATHRVGDDAFQLNASISQSTSVKVKYESSSTSIATVDADGKMTCVAPGLVKITATYDGDDNFKACPDANKISYLFVVSPADLGTVAILSNETVPFLISTGESGTFDITSTAAANFFVSSSNTTGWSNTDLSNIADGATIYFKFQPNCTTAVSKDFTITHNSKTYTVNLVGAGAENLLAFGTVDIPHSTNSNWYSLPASFFNASSDTYSITITDNDNPSSSNKTIMVQILGQSFRRTIPEAQSSTNQFRVGFYPKNETTVSYTITIKDSHFNISYPLIVTGTGDEKVYENFPTIAVGTATDDDYDFAIYMRYFDASDDITITAPDHLLLRRGTNTSGTWQWSDTWTKSLEHIGMRENIKVRLAPESKIASSYTAYVIIHDNYEDDDAENYRYGFVIPAIDDNVYAFNENTPVMGISTETKTHTLSNFIPAGDITIDATGKNFLVSKTGADNTYGSTLTIGTSEAKVFYIKFAPISATSADDYITITDVTTERTYQIKCTGTPGTTTFANTNIGQASTETLFQYESYFGAGTTVEISSSNPTVFRAFPEGQESSTNTAINTGNKFSISSGKFGVKFYPEVTGKVTGTITITSTTDPSKTVSIPVEGIGVQQSYSFGSNDSRVPRGTIQQHTFTLDNFVTRDGFTITAQENSSIFNVVQTQSTEFTVIYLPTTSNNYIDDIIIHENQFGEDHTHDKVIKIYGYNEALATATDFGTVDVMGTSSTTASITLSGFTGLSGYKLTCDEPLSFSIGGKNVEQDAADGTYQIQFKPVRSGDFNDQNIFIYHVDVPSVHYPLLKVTGHSSTVDISSSITWPKTTIRANSAETGMAEVSNTYSGYVDINYELVSNIGTSIFYDHQNAPTGYGLDEKHIYARGAGSANIKAVIVSKDGSGSFYGNATTEITAIEKSVQNIIYPDNGHYVALNESITVKIYAYDIDSNTPIDADITMSAVDGSKVSVTRDNSSYNQTTKEWTFTISGLATGATTLNVTSVPTSSSYMTQTFENISITVLASSDNCSGTTCKVSGVTYSNSTSGKGGSHDYTLSGAPVKSIKVKFTYNWDTPTLTISDNLGHTFYNDGPGLSPFETTETINVNDIVTNFGIIKPTQLTINVAGATSTSGSQKVVVEEVMQYSYFNTVTADNTNLNFGDVTVDNVSAEETISIDYSALHRNMDFALSGGDDSQFTITNLSQLQGLISGCTDHGTANINVKFTPNRVEENIVETLTVTGYYTDASGNGQSQVYHYILKGNSKQKTQVITWNTSSSYSIIDLDNRTLTLDARSSENLPITYSMTDDAGGVATFANGVVTVLKAGTIRVKAEQGGTEKVQAADPQYLNIKFNLEPQIVTWDYVNFSGTTTVNTKNITTAFGTTTGIPLDAKLYDNHGNLLDFDVDYLVTTESGNTCSTEPLIRVEKNTSDGRFYAYYNNNGVGTAKITATREGDDTYSKVEPEAEKTAYIVISKATPTVTYDASELKSLHYGDKLTLSVPETDIYSADVTDFTYTVSTASDLSAAATDYVEIDKAESELRKSELSAKKATTSNLYIRANQTYNECFNNEGHSTPTKSFDIDKSDLKMVWNQPGSLLTRAAIGQNETQIGSTDLVAPYAIDKRHSETVVGYKETYLSKNGDGDVEVTEDIDLTYTCTEGTSNSYLPGKSAIARYDASTGKVIVTGYGSGTATLTVTENDGVTGKYYGITDDADKASITVRVDKITPVLSLAGVPNTITFGDDPVTVTGHAKLNVSDATDIQDCDNQTIYSINGTYGKLELTSADPTIVQVNGSTLSFLKAGSTSVSLKIVDQNGNNGDAISNESSVSVQIEVKPASQQIDWTPITATDILTTATAAAQGIELNAVARNTKSTADLTGATITYSITDNTIAEIVENGGKSYLVAKKNGTGSVTVKATAVDQNGNYSQVEDTKTFNVVLADASLSADPNSVSLTYPQDLASGQTITLTLDGDADAVWNTPVIADADLFEFDQFSSSQKTASVVLKPKAKKGSSTVTFSTQASDNYMAATLEVTVNVVWGTIDLVVDATKLDLTTATHEENLNNITGFVSSNYLDNSVTYTYQVKDWTGVAADCSITEDCKLTIKSLGDITLEVTASHVDVASVDTTLNAIKVKVGTLTFSQGDQSDADFDHKWTTAANWAPHRDRIPDATNFNVQINDYCFIGKDSATTKTEADYLSHRVDAACNNLTIDGTNAKLVIGEASTLRVKGTLIDNLASQLVLTANKWGQASVGFGNTENYPKATVEMYIPSGNGSRTSPRWQYRGIIVDNFAVAGGPWKSMAIYWWKESDNDELKHGCWQSVTNGGDSANIHLNPWTGYCFANMGSGADTVAKCLAYTGTLINSDKTLDLTYTLKTYKDSNGDDVKFANVGVNLVTNSYAVPLRISRLAFSDNNIDSAVVLYNAGTYQDWKTGGESWNKRGHKGQFTTIPIKTGNATWKIDSIPAGQAFFVNATNTGATLSIDYSGDTIMSPSGRLYMPREELEPEFNILMVNVEANSNGASDRLALLECEDCSRKYDNGYDGKKKIGDSGLPQLYAYNKFGNTAVNADSTFNKQYIGFTAGSDDETYTISFETDRLFGYHSLYLTDRKLNQTVDILAGETYQFQGYTVGENMRFQINGVTEEEWENNEDENEDDNDSSECDLRVIGNTLYVEGLTTYGYQATNIEIYDMTGNRVWSTPLTSARVYDLPTLPQSIYVIRVGDCFVKYR